MRISLTLSIYVARQLMLWIAIMFIGIASLMLTLDMIEQLRKAAGKPDVAIGVILQLSLLQLPYLVQKTLPFIILFGSMMAFWRLSRSNELVIARAAGISAWQFLMPAIVLGAVVGALQMMVLNPLSSSLLSKFEHLEAEYMNRSTSRLSVSRTGVWLRQGDEHSQTVINASRITPDGARLLNVTFFTFERTDSFVYRIDASSADLEDGYWLLTNAVRSSLDETGISVGNLRVATDLTRDKIQNSFASPETLSFWALPGFIRTLEVAGFSGHRHRLYWHNLLSLPVLIGAMVLFAAVFTLKTGGRNSASLTVGAGVICSFLLYFLSDIIYAMGLSGSLPPELSAWSPPAIATLLGLAMVFHLEDG